MKVLYCDDSPDHLDRYKEKLERTWRKLVREGELPEPLSLDVRVDIVRHGESEGTIELQELWRYDAIMLDILWPGDAPYGVDLAEAIRAEYPEMPIMMFTVSSEASHFNRLLKVGICAYLTKAERSSKVICLQMFDGVNRARKARSGHCLYKLIRQVTAQGGWYADCVSKAASAVWRYERPHDRWAAFRDAFAQPLADYRLRPAFQKMWESFGDADLLVLGALPGMRGHLDHVLNVYFTGYVISNLNDRFRKAAIDTATRLFPANTHEIEDKEDEFWGLFQLSWLAAATLHDAAYSLETMPDIYHRCEEMQKAYGCVCGQTDAEAGGEAGTVTLAEGSETLENMAKLLVRLGTAFPTQFLESNRTFEKAPGDRRVNHGVACGVLFVTRAMELAELRNQIPELGTYLTWAGAAIALHSLKKPGSAEDVCISAKTDPLSYLLMACDEIQVWERERPDANMMVSPFKDTDLVRFEVSDSAITADVDYSLYGNIDTSAKLFIETRDTLDGSIVEDNECLNKYVDGDGLEIRVNRGISATGFQFSPLCF